MKQQRTYDKVVEVLREVKPTLREPEDLTDQIMDRLQRHQTLDRRGINISDNAGKWNIFIGFRTVAAIAAIFLIGFFVFQQWELMSKVSSLEMELYKAKVSNFSLKNPENIEKEHFKQLLRQEFKAEKVNLIQSNDYKQVIDNQKLTELFIRAYFQLQDENQSLKKMIEEKYSNSINKENVKQSKL